MESDKPLLKLHFYKFLYYIAAITLTLLEVEYNEGDINSQVLLIGLFVASFFIDQKLKYVINHTTRFTKSVGVVFSILLLFALFIIFMYNTFTSIDGLFKEHILFLIAIFSVLLIIQISDWLVYGRSEQENVAYLAGIDAARENKISHQKSIEESEKENRDRTKKFLGQKDKSKTNKKTRRQNKI